MQLHLEIEGIISGDMFTAALLDAFPRLEPRVLAAVDAVDAWHPLVCSLLLAWQGAIPGSRFQVEPFNHYFGDIPLAFPDEIPTWSTLRESVLTARLTEGIRKHAMRMFHLFVEAESFAQRVPVGAVEFREIDAWATMAEIVAAAALIDSLGTVRWTASAAREFDRMNGTAAAILRHVCPSREHRRESPPNATVIGRGNGFGADQSTPSRLRVICFDAAASEIARPLQPAQYSARLSGRQ
jgi:uncharacterized protein (DUF111 family)